MTNANEFLRPGQVPRAFPISEATVRKWLLSRRLPHTKFGRAVLIRRADIEAILTANRVEAREAAR